MQNLASEATDTSWFNPFDTSYIHDPYPAVARLHATFPTFYHEALGFWVVSKHADVKGVLRDADTFSSKVFGHLPPPDDLAPKLTVLTETELLLGMDRPEHPALRNPLASVFTHKLVTSLEPAIRERADALIDDFIADGQCELMSQFSYPFALATAIGVFGMPSEDIALFREWSDDFMKMLTLRPAPGEAAPEHPMSAEERRARWTNLLDAKDYFTDYVARLKSEPGEDVFSKLLALRDADGNQQVSDESAIANIPNFVAAGHDTTANLIGQAIVLLTDNPDQRQTLLADDSLMPQAVEEILRMRGSGLGLLRRAKTEAVVGGVTIPAGSIVYVLLGGAGLDADVFEDPDRFDITRKNADQHLAFGIGRHSCIGSQLAKLQARIAISRLLDRIPDIRVSPSLPVTYSPGLPLRLTTSLPVEW